MNRDLSFRDSSDWSDYGLMLRSRSERNAWDLGDWLIAGEAWDLDFTLSQKLTGYSRSHLYNLKRTAVAFPPHVRSYNLAHASHLLLLRVTDEELRKEMHAGAVKGHWTVDITKTKLDERGVAKQVRAEFKQDKAKVRAGSRRWHQARVECPQCHHVFPILGHKAKDMATAIKIKEAS